MDNNEGDVEEDEEVVIDLLLLSSIDKDLVGSGTGSRDVVGLDEDGNDDIVVAVVVLGVVGIDLDVPAAATAAAATADEPGEEAAVVGLILIVGEVNFKPSIKADITPTAFDLYNFEWN